MTSLLVGVPIKPFGVAKARLAPALDARARSSLGREIAAHTLRTVEASGARAAVVTADPGVSRWARRHQWEVLTEAPGQGLDAAARAVTEAAHGAPWAIVHADLPLLTAADLAAAWDALVAGSVLAPSHDGGTTLVAGRGAFPFSYGPGSFFRHLAAAPAATVVVRVGLALDLDTVTDLTGALRLPAGAWLRAHVPGGDTAHADYLTSPL
jgi:2-phospho-L-lactate guanylyltransferase